MLTFEILGIPKPKQSARFRIMKNKAGKQFISSYQKKEVTDNEANIGWSVIQQLPKDFQPFDCAIGMEAEYVFPIPSSMKKKDVLRVEQGEKIYKPTKPDLPDNLQKIVCDSLAGIVYTNDSRITFMKVEKYYGTTPKTILRFWEL